MKTIIKIKTYMCPTGLNNIDAPCRFHRESTNLPIDGKCPSCNKLLVLASSPDDKITMTVMGEEDIETEITSAKNGDRKDIDVSTLDKENAYRIKRKKDIADAIAKARLLEDKQ